MKHLFRLTIYSSLIFLLSCNDQTDNKDQAATPSVLPASTSSITPDQKDTSISGLTLNPQHGQPGHRCEIAVGAPLNAPAASNSAQSTVTPSPVIVPSKTPQIVPNTSTNATTATLNPKHGEPGHRCDIAVGAPLNSKPNQ